jgi:hypothetical protein
MKPQKLSEPTVKISGPKATITIVEQVNPATGTPVHVAKPEEPAGSKIARVTRLLRKEGE